jgi:hypothetical protein
MFSVHAHISTTSKVQCLSDVTDDEQVTHRMMAELSPWGPCLNIKQLSIALTYMQAAAICECYGTFHLLQTCGKRMKQIKHRT